ncbi:MAG: MFS transporter [Firmicutes bacterium]|nr:MFS transporter [Alicyclobacillaceae bacterium]MCL6498155.1 MFS transporter [Bacillota bacterium]
MEDSRQVAYGWMVTILLALMWGGVGLNRLGIAYLMPKIVPQFHFALWQVGIIISGLSMTWAISSYVGGYFADRVGRKKVMVPAFLLTSVFTMLTGLAGGFWSLLLIRELTGLGDGVGWQAGESIISDNLPYRYWGIAQTIFSGGYTLVGAGVGAFVMTRLAEAWSWQGAFVVIGIYGLVVGLILLFVLDPKRERVRPEQMTAREHLQGYVEMFRQGKFWLATAIQMLGVAWLTGFSGFAALFLTKVQHVSLVQVGSLLSVWGLVGFGGMLLLGWVSDRIGRRPVLAGAGLINGVLLLLLSHTVMPLGALFVLLAISGICGYSVIPISAATVLNELVNPRDKAKAMGVANGTSVIIGTFVFPIVEGFVASAGGLPSAIALVGVIFLLIFPLALILGESRRQAPLATGAAVSE